MDLKINLHLLIHPDSGQNTPTASNVSPQSMGHTKRAKSTQLLAGPIDLPIELGTVTLPCAMGIKQSVVVDRGMSMNYVGLLRGNPSIRF